jgi:hypothetical protein
VAATGDRWFLSTVSIEDKPEEGIEAIDVERLPALGS